MKKSFIKRSILLVSAVLLSANLAGCCIPIPNPQNITQNDPFDDDYDLPDPDPVIDDDYDYDLPDTDLDLPESGITPSGDNGLGGNTVKKIEWAKETVNGSDSEIIYTNGVSDDFELGNGLTFGEVADFFAYAIERFDKENFRYLFSQFSLCNCIYILH